MKNKIVALALFFAVLFQGCNQNQLEAGRAYAKEKLQNQKVTKMCMDTSLFGKKDCPKGFHSTDIDILYPVLSTRFCYGFADHNTSVPEMICIEKDIIK